MKWGLSIPLRASRICLLGMEGQMLKMMMAGLGRPLADDGGLEGVLAGAGWRGLPIVGPVVLGLESDLTPGIAADVGVGDDGLGGF